MTDQLCASSTKDISNANLISVSTSYLAAGYNETSASPVSGSQIYRVDIQVFQYSGAPAGNQDMAVYLDVDENLSDLQLPATINGQALNLVSMANGTPDNVKTDGTGKLVIEISQQNTPSLPVIQVLDNQCFPPATTSITPDFENLKTLGSLTSDQLSSGQATAYDGSDLIPSQYQQQQYLDAIAQGVSNAMGSNGAQDVQLSLAPRQMVSLNDAKEITKSIRNWSPGKQGSFTVQISDTSVSFSPGADDTLAQGAKLSFKGFEDFVDDVYKDGKKLAKISWKALESEASALVNVILQGLEDVYQFTVTTLESAAKVAVGLLGSLADGVERVLEWLSYIFDWKDIVNTADLITGAATDNLNTFLTNLQNSVDTVNEGIESAKTKLKDALSTAFGESGYVNTYLSGSLGDIQQQQTAKVSPAMGGALASCHSQTSWAAVQVNTSPNTASLALPASDNALSALDNELKTVYDKLVTQIDLGDLKQDIEKLFNDITSVVKSPDTLMSNGISVILGFLNDAADTFIDLMAVAAEAILDLFADLITAFINFLTSPVEDNFLAKIYRALTKEPLSIVGLASLIVAIPTTVIMKVLNIPNVSATEAIKDSAQPSLLDIAGIARDFAEGVCNGLKAVPDSQIASLGVLSVLSTGLSVIGFSLGMASIISDTSAANILFCCVAVVPLLLEGTNYVLNKLGGAEASSFESQGKPIISTAYGVIMVLFSISYAVAYPTEHFEPDGVPLITGVIGEIPDLISGLPLLSEALGITEETGEVIVQCAEIVCPMAVASIEALELEVEYS